MRGDRPWWAVVRVRVARAARLVLSTVASAKASKIKKENNNSALLAGSSDLRIKAIRGVSCSLYVHFFEMLFRRQNFKLQSFKKCP